MNVLARKLSIIAALIAMVLVLVMGGLSGLSLDLLLIRGAAAFFMIMIASMILFHLALKDRERTTDNEDHKEE